jgi:hypothetical protein
LPFNPEDGGDMFLRNDSSLSMDLHGVIFQKIELFITTVVGTSDTCRDVWHTPIAVIVPPDCFPLIFVYFKYLR